MVVQRPCHHLGVKLLLGGIFGAIAPFPSAPGHAALGLLEALLLLPFPLLWREERRSWGGGS